MLREMLLSKIHRARVSQTDLNYVGSLTVPRELLEAVDMLPGERVEVANLNNGARFHTYLMAGEKPGYFCVNGAAARLCEPDDVIIIFAYGWMEDHQARNHRPRVALMNERNEVASLEH